MVYCLILYIFLILNFVRMNLSYLLFDIFAWNCFIFYASFNYDFLLFKWIFYYNIVLLLVLFLFLFRILHILSDTYCFLSIRIFSPFFLSNLKLLLLFLCSWCSWIDDIIQTATGNKSAFILHELLKQFGVFYRIQINLTVILVFWLRGHFCFFCSFNLI